MERLHLEEATEALHLASLLCHYGYFFPITDSKNLNVKDDGSLYRFQVRRVNLTAYLHDIDMQFRIEW